jgi:hypothetical protein
MSPAAHKVLAHARACLASLADGRMRDASYHRETAGRTARAAGWRREPRLGHLMLAVTEVRS